MHWKQAILPLFLSVVAFSGARSIAEQPQNFTTPTQPEQPKNGPGGSEEKHHSVVHMKLADGGAGGILFLPSDPKPAKAPVVIFCHGWGAIQPSAYQAWIDHLVKRGNIVLWTYYQDDLLTPSRLFLPNAIRGVKKGLKMLEDGEGGIRPDLERVAVIGHSAGGMVAAGIAARATAEGLPKIRAAMPVEPGDSRRGVPLADPATIASDTLLLVLLGEEDVSVPPGDGTRVIHESKLVPESHKALLMLHSDHHGSPELVANHFAPTAMVKADGSYEKQPVRQAMSRNRLDIGVVNAMDFYGTWRLADQLLDAAFNKDDSAAFFNDDKKLLHMGAWSDGVEVAPLTKVR